MIDLTTTRSLLLFVLGASLLAPLDAQRKRGSWRDRVQFLEQRDLRFESKALGQESRYSIFLPRGYRDEANKEQRYPVVYFLHGMWEDCNRFGDRGGAAVLNKMAKDGSLPPLIFVCAHDHTRASFYVNGVRAKMEDMLLEDLIPHVEGKYRVAKGRHNRALLGVSMGGFGALKIALRNPGVFGTVAAHSAAILPEDPDRLLQVFPWAKRRISMVHQIFGDPVDKKLWRAVNPLSIARELDKKQLAGLRIHFDCGDQDRYGFAGPNQELHALLKKRGIPHSWRLVKGGNHGWNTRRTEAGYNQTALPHSLRFIAAGFAQKQGTKGLSGLLGGEKTGK